MLHNLLREFSVDSADVFLLDLPGTDLLLHFAGLFGVPAEEQQSGSESVQPVDRPQILQAALFGQDEDDRVVAVTAARMNLRRTKTD